MNCQLEFRSLSIGRKFTSESESTKGIEYSLFTPEGILK